MRYNPLYLSLGLSAPLLLLLIVNLLLSFAVALFIGSKRVTGFWISFFLSLFTSAIIGLIITICCKTKKQKAIETALANKFSHSDAIMQEIQKLKLLRRSGVISKTEYETEMNRLLHQ